MDQPIEIGDGFPYRCWPYRYRPHRYRLDSGRGLFAYSILSRHICSSSDNRVNHQTSGQ